MDVKTATNVQPCERVHILVSSLPAVSEEDGGMYGAPLNSKCMQKAFSPFQSDANTT